MASGLLRRTKYAFVCQTWLFGRFGSTRMSLRLGHWPAKEVVSLDDYKLGSRYFSSNGLEIWPFQSTKASAASLSSHRPLDQLNLLVQSQLGRVWRVNLFAGSFVKHLGGFLEDPRVLQLGGAGFKRRHVIHRLEVEHVGQSFDRQDFARLRFVDFGLGVALVVVDLRVRRHGAGTQTFRRENRCRRNRRRERRSGGRRRVVTWNRKLEVMTPIKTIKISSHDKVFFAKSAGI